MSDYREMLTNTIWAAVVIWFAWQATRNADVTAVAQAREERCVVDLGRQLAQLEIRYAPVLLAYQLALAPTERAVE